MTGEKRGYTREEAATYTGVSIYKIRAAIRNNHLPARRLGKDTIILREDLDMWLENAEVA